MNGFSKSLYARRRGVGLTNARTCRLLIMNAGRDVVCALITQHSVFIAAPYGVAGLAPCSLSGGRQNAVQPVGENAHAQSTRD